MSFKVLSGALVVLSLTILSCGTLAHKDFNPSGVPAEELVTLNVDKEIKLAQIDGKKVSILSGSAKTHIIKLPAGEHEITMYYGKSNLGSYSSTERLTLRNTFDIGKEYKLIAGASKDYVSFHFRECTPLDKKVTNRELKEIPVPTQKPEIFVNTEPKGKKFQIIGTVQVTVFPVNRWPTEADANEALLKAGTEYSPDAYIDAFYYKPTTFLEQGSIVVNAVAVKYLE